MAVSAKLKVLAVSSGGGHWVQLLRLEPALRQFRVVFLTVDKGYRSSVAPYPVRVVVDATRWNRLKQIQQAFQVLFWVLWERPSVVLSTGASPGFYALVFGKMVGARTIWIDSIANADELSMAGRRVRRFADMWLTQWPHIASEHGPDYRGSVI